ncbi:MAG: glycerophosphodiester phosphodiesterase [Chloroflexota bacterium]|nr:glycerophosphodiester phosphodiesterase [Chloroflexota bacterium]
MWKKVPKLLLGLVAVSFVIYTVLAFLAKPIPDHPFFDFNRDGILVMAHRGGRRLWPENTLYAFEHAVELGVDVLEMDIHSTKDGVLVVIHDHTVDRTTDGAGAVQGFTLAELEELDAGHNWTADEGQSFPFRGQGLAVPTLDEVFVAFPDVPMNIEIKQTQPSITAPLCQMIRERGMTERVLIASFDADTVREFRRACPEVATTSGEDEVRILFGLNQVFLGAIYSPPAEALQVPEYSGDLHVVTERFVNTAHERNMEVHVWTVNDIDDMQRFLNLGVDGIITDYPDQLLALLGR